jgi:6-phosphofructokinase 1
VCEFVPEFAKRAGPRALIYHDPATTHAAIVNCGGLCPGINDVIRSVVTTLETGYGVTEISGIRFGFGGFWKEGVSNLKLTRSNTSGVQRAGGSVIGTGRGGGDVPKIVDSIERQGINMVFVIGGNGSHAGRGRHQRRVRASRTRGLRGGYPEDHRQRHPAHRQDVWI